MLVLIAFSCAIFILTFIYINGRYNEVYWKKRGVTFHSKNKLLGPLWDYVTKDQTLFEIFNDLYKIYPKEPAVGIGSLVEPALYVKDPANVQHVLQSDFQSFSDKGFDFNVNDKLADNVTFMKGIRWKLMRQNLSPLFTPTKLKKMFYIMDRSSQTFIESLKNNPEKQKRNAYGTLTEFCLTAISGAVFGIDTELNQNSELLKVSRESANTGKFKIILASIYQPIFKLLGFKVFGEYENFFFKTMKQVIRQRENDGDAKRHDFPEMCINLQKKGAMKDVATGFELEPTDELLAAQAFFFFFAGVEPCATAIFCTLIELGQHLDILQMLHDEIDQAYENNGEELSADIISDLNYLEKVLYEGLRKYPPVGLLTRKCINDTVLPVGNIKIDKGTKIFTPIFEIHRDPNYYPNPEKFDPERFTDMKLAGSAAYMPFGKGNRMCIGARYAMLQMKTVMVHILRNFTVQTKIGDGGIKFQKVHVFMRVVNVDLEFVPRSIRS